ncbi:MAG: DsbA family protein, partial [Bacillota bacterium]|nr:DsbA family protein [Bacillota bacterium]
QRLQAYLQEAGDELFEPGQKLAEKWAVNGVPTFVVDDRFKVVGSDQGNALRQAIEKVLKE